MLEIGKLYYFSGSTWRVTKVTDTHIHKVWANGQVPNRYADKMVSISMLPYFRLIG